MSFWTAIVIIVALGVISEMYRVRLKSGSKKLLESNRELRERVSRLEERMASVETILIEQEKKRPFADLGS